MTLIRLEGAAVAALEEDVGESAPDVRLPFRTRWKTANVASERSRCATIPRACVTSARTDARTSLPVAATPRPPTL
jgi:hypothetical protein